MQIRFHRSFGIGKLVRLHVSKRGLGLSVGPRGFHVGIDSLHRPYVSAGIPGTGIYVRQNFPIESTNAHMNRSLTSGGWRPTRYPR